MISRTSYLHSSNNLFGKLTILSNLSTTQPIPFSDPPLLDNHGPTRYAIFLFNIKYYQIIILKINNNSVFKSKQII